MKKLMIASAIAASIGSGAANATIYTITSNVNLALELWYAGIDLATPPCVVGTPHLSFGGFAYDNNNDFAIESANATLTGEIVFDPSCAGTPPQIRLTFSLTNGTYTAGGTNPGLNFTGGTVQIDGYWPTTGWLPYSTINAATTNIPFLQGLVGPLGGSQVTAGVVFPPLANPVATNVVPLPGLSGGAPGTGNNALSSINVGFGPAGLFGNGNINLIPW